MILGFAEHRGLMAAVEVVGEDDDELAVCMESTLGVQEKRVADEGEVVVGIAVVVG